jgi:hypothetical protein
MMAWIYRVFVLEYDRSEIDYKNFKGLLITYFITGIGMIIRNLKYPERKYSYVFDIWVYSHFY